MSGYTPKLIDGNDYLLWTDALHSRELAMQATNKWDKAAYVRWTILLSWTVLEMACQDALDNPKISYSFQRRINETVQVKKLVALNWGSGTWQKVNQLQKLRKDIVHRFSKESNLFPDIDIADFAINISRNAVKAIYAHVGKEIPAWINDDSDAGWSGQAPDNSVRSSISANATLIKKGAQGVENPLKIYFVTGGEEKLSDVLGPEEDFKPYVESILTNAKVAISEIKVLHAEDIVFQKSYNIRGT